MAYTLSSNPGLAPVRSRRRRVSLPLVAFGIIFAGWWSAVALVVGVDPLNLFPWGMTPKLRNVDYGPNGTPYLVDVAVKDASLDAVLIGSSTSQAFTREMMTSILPDTHKALNLSYPAPRAGDRELVTKEIAAHTHAKRILLALDWFYMTKDTSAVETDDAGNSFPVYLYDSNPFNDVRAVNFNNLRLAFMTLLGRPLWLPNWSYPEYLRGNERGYRHYQSPLDMSREAARIHKYKNVIGAPTEKTCADLRVVNEQLVPFARTLSQRHVLLDVYFPPLSLAAYYVWMADGYRVKRVGPTFMSDYLLLQRCVVNGLDGIAGVRIFAFDNDEWLTGDLKNYRDAAHPFGEENYKYMLRAIAEGSHRLTAQNVDEAVASLSGRIRRYTLTNSNFRKPDGPYN